jgi:hypothetical protein
LRAGRAVVARRAAGVGLVLAPRAVVARGLSREWLVVGASTKGACGLRKLGVVLAGRAVVAEVLAVQVLVGTKGAVVAPDVALARGMVARGATVA